jgi:hypothetical protein
VHRSTPACSAELLTNSTGRSSTMTIT